MKGYQPSIVRSFLVLFLTVSITLSWAQDSPAYKDSTLPIDTRVKDLLSRMTPEEKFWQLFMIPGGLEAGKEDQYKNGIFGFQVDASGTTGGAAGQLLKYDVSKSSAGLAKKINSIQRYFVEKTRLGIPIIAFDEALHGLVREGATAFPQAIGLAASFDTALMSEVAHAIAVETKSRGIRDILTPVVNIASDPRWGRTEETYGEDPFLSSEMGVAFVRQFENLGIVTTPKHFIANVGDGGRDSYPIHYSERLMEEIYYPPFRACFERGGSRSVMTAYNSVNGSPATANHFILTEKLKKEWGFKGFVISDASAVGGANVLHYTASDYWEAGQQAITAGLDVIFQTAYDHHRLFIAPFLDGRIQQARIDDAVSRVLRAKFELALFENPYVPENSPVHSSAHKEIAKRAAIRSMVLLKNEKDILPLSTKYKRILVIGEDATEARLGGYSGPGNNKVSILTGLKERVGSRAQISYAPGVPRISSDWKVIPASALQNASESKKGLLGEYFSNSNLEGKSVLTRVDESINFHWTLYPPDPSLPADDYSVRWTGQLLAPVTGSVRIGVDGNDGFRLYLDNKLLIDQWDKRSYSTLLKTVQLEKGRKYSLRLEFHEPVGNAHCRLIWDYGVKKDQQQRINEAVAAARNAEIVIVAAGIEEGEFRDRAMLSLPGKQEEMIQKVVATGKPVVVLLVGGSAITMSNWLNKVQGVLNVWYPGEEGGKAVAAVLYGDENPAGRLPITYPVHESQLPLVYNHKPTGRGDDYNNLSGLPLFPFGYGLSYTQFKYDSIRLSSREIKAGDSVRVNINVSNIGNRDGDEVVQLYIRDLLSSVSRPVMELKGFQRVSLAKGETKELSFMITPEMLSMFDVDMKKIIEPGEFRIMIGGSSRDLPAKVTLLVK